MPTKQDFVISFDEQEYIRLHDDGFQRCSSSRAGRLPSGTWWPKSKRLSGPPPFGTGSQLRQFQHEKVLLANGVKLGGGPVVTVIGGAEELIIAYVLLELKR